MGRRGRRETSQDAVPQPRSRRWGSEQGDCSGWRWISLKVGWWDYLRNWTCRARERGRTMTRKICPEQLRRERLCREVGNTVTGPGVLLTPICYSTHFLPVIGLPRRSELQPRNLFWPLFTLGPQALNQVPPTANQHNEAPPAGKSSFPGQFLLQPLRALSLPGALRGQRAEGRRG